MLIEAIETNKTVEKMRQSPAAAKKSQILCYCTMGELTRAILASTAGWAYRPHASITEGNLHSLDRPAQVLWNEMGDTLAVEVGNIIGITGESYNGKRN